MTPWVIYILSVVQRGPVPYGRLVSDAASLVPPGRGYRQALANRSSARVRNGLPEKSDEMLAGDKNEAIRAGQRYLVTSSISGLRQRGRVAIYFDGDVKMVGAGPHDIAD